MGLWKKTLKSVSILIGGPVPVLWMNEDGSEEREISDMDIIKRFHGEERNILTNGVPKVVHLTEFLFDGPSNELLEGVGISGGIMRFEFSESHNQLWLVTEYYAPRKLNDEEVHVLSDFTIGQWLDGAGEGWGSELRELNGGIAPLSHPVEVYAWQEP